MPECQRCGSHVMEHTVRVLYPHNGDTVDGCVHCGDMTYVPGEGYKQKRN